MGASSWGYFVSFQPDVNNALQELRQKVFKEGGYFKPGEWQRQLYEHGIVNQQELELALKELAKIPEPKTLDELIEQRDYEGTHSIIDMAGISSHPELGKCVPLTAQQIQDLFGTDTPTRIMVEDKAQQILDLQNNWMGTYVIVYKDNLPYEIYFAGYSGD